VELKFNNGNVKVFPLMLENASDVMAYIEKFQVEEQVVAPSS
jgi:hypothetical protein